MPIKHDRKPDTSKTNEKFDTEFDRQINAWAEAHIEASKREGSRSEELQRESLPEMKSRSV